MVLKHWHKWLISSTFLLGLLLLNLFSWQSWGLSGFLTFILFVMMVSQSLKSKTYLVQLQKYEAVSVKFLQNDEITYVPPIVVEDREIIGIMYNKLMRNLQRQAAVNQSNSQIIHSFSRVIEAPLVILNSNGWIDYANDSFKLWHSGSDIRKVRLRALRHVLQDALIREIPQKKEVQLDAQYFIAASNPIYTEKGQVRGVVVLFHDVTDLKNYQNLQKDFFGNASHELKTPISAIKGCTEILLRGNHDQEVYSRFLGIIEEENNRLERLVQDLLLINRYEYHQIQLQKENISLKDLLKSCLAQVLNIATLKNQQLTLTAEKDCHFIGDYTKMQQSFLNLLSNAIHYSGEGAQISVHLQETSKGDISIIFQDNGIGIPAKDLPHIFERFYRVDKARSRYTGGSGLGLSVVYSIVEAHGGKISVTSKVGEGTRFEIQLKK